MQIKKNIKDAHVIPPVCLGDSRALLRPWRVPLSKRVGHRRQNYQNGMSASARGVGSLIRRDDGHQVRREDLLRAEDEPTLYRKLGVGESKCKKSSICVCVLFRVLLFLQLLSNYRFMFSLPHFLVNDILSKLLSIV